MSNTPDPTATPDSTTPARVNAGTYVEGNVRTQGDFVGGDKGLNGQEVAQLIDVLLKHFSRSTVQNPNQLDQALANFYTYHEQLYEWKELHNYLDNTLQAFEQFSAQVTYADARRAPLDMRELRNLWFPVGLSIEQLTTWAAQVNNIGERYSVGENGELRGERWAIDLESRRRDFAAHLQISPGTPTGSVKPPAGGVWAQRVRYMLGMDVYWWEQLIDQTRQLNHLILQHIHFADKMLRETATQLYYQSKNVSGTLPHILPQEGSAMQGEGR